MHPDEFGQSGSVKLPLTPAISNIFHAPSKTMETSSHLVEPLIPTQLVMVFEILIWNSTVALSGRLLVSKEGILAPRQGRRACCHFSYILDYFILIQRDSRSHSSTQFSPIFESTSNKPLGKSFQRPYLLGGPCFPASRFSWPNEYLGRWRNELWEMYTAKKSLLL